MNMIEIALHYKNDLGLNVLPVNVTWNELRGKYEKKPLVPWSELQKKEVTDEDIKNWWTQFPEAGIAAVMGSISGGVVAIDCDSQKAIDDIEAILPDGIIIPCSKSISGARHYFFYSDVPLKKQVRFYSDMDLQSENSLITLPPTRSKSGDEYSWLIKPKSKSDFANLTSALQGTSIYNNISTLYKGTTKQPQPTTTTTNHNDHKRPQMFLSGTRDNDLFHTANCLVKGGMPDDEIAQVLERIILSWGENPDQKWIDSKIKSAIGRIERRQKNWTEEVRDYITTTDGYITTTDCHKQLQATTSDHKKAINMALLRMKEAGIIEKYGEKSGTYKKTEQLEESIIDLASADNTSLPLKLPLGIHEMVKIMPKNIIIIAGESNAGKSAFLLNTAAENMIDHKVFYFSSEMGGAELKERLLNFTERVPLQMWEHCTFIERSNDFDIAIRPNDINIIDFLEINDEFYKIGSFIKKIFDKLDKGIAIIAIQKNKGRDEGLGGARSTEKARLYLSMRPGFIKIVKAKNWVSGLINPNGMEKPFKLTKGMFFSDVKKDGEKLGWVKADD
ncbi:hypothetical protein [Methanosarcina virus MetMV]|nr:hypothetical protein [Methanosarcina virus MetMV]AZF89918.1 hypothetical protein [Methanosarcina virus MetMV]